MKLAITGANSSVGKALLDAIVAKDDITAIAGVRSSRKIINGYPSQKVRWVEIGYGKSADGANSANMAQAFRDADSVVHLAGVLIEGPGSDYQTANVDATASVVAAAKAAGAGHIVFVSVVGADTASSNGYFRSKGLAEQQVLDSGLAASIIRTPLLLGRGTAGSSGIMATAAKPVAKLLGGGVHTLQPLDVRDLVAAILGCCAASCDKQGVFEMAGPEPVVYHELIRRVAALQGNEISIGAVPITLAKLVAAVMSRIRGGGFTPTVIDVITRDETLPRNDAAALGVSLTPLDDTLRAMVQDP